MSDARWNRIDQLLQSALGLPKPEREAFIRDACTDDDGVRDEVLSLLAHAGSADKFLEQIKQEVAESKAAVEVATGSIDTQAIERERTSRKVKAAGILHQFEVEMGLSKPTAVAESSAAPSVGGRVGEKQGS